MRSLLCVALATLISEPPSSKSLEEVEQKMKGVFSKPEWKATDYRKKFDKDLAGRLYGEREYSGPSSSRLEHELQNEHEEYKDRMHNMKQQLQKIDTQFDMHDASRPRPSSFLQEKTLDSVAKWKAGFQDFEDKMASLQKQTEAEFKEIPAVVPQHAESFLQTDSLEDTGRAAAKVDLATHFAAIGKNIQKIWAQTNKSLEEARDRLLYDGSIKPTESLEDYLESHEGGVHSKVHDMFREMKKKFANLQVKADLERDRIDKDLATHKGGKATPASFLEVEPEFNDLKTQIAEIKAQASRELGEYPTSFIEEAARSKLDAHYGNLATAEDHLRRYRK